MTSYQETSFRTREVTETLRFSPELSTVNYPPVMSRKRNFHEEKNWVDYTTEAGGYRKEFKTQTTHNIIQVTAKFKDVNETKCQLFILPFMIFTLYFLRTKNCANWFGPKLNLNKHT